MTTENLRTQLENKLREMAKLKDRELELEGKVAKTSQQVHFIGRALNCIRNIL